MVLSTCGINQAYPREDTGFRVLAEVPEFTDLLSATPRHAATLLVVPCKFILPVEIEHAPEDQILCVVTGSWHDKLTDGFCGQAFSSSTSFLFTLLQST